ncbi:MAG: hypothetical protein JOY84_01555 [Curvibacter sp.]|nr:hypothetical protein [Curvibacter sp.]
MKEAPVHSSLPRRLCRTALLWGGLCGAALAQGQGLEPAHGSWPLRRMPMPAAASPQAKGVHALPADSRPLLLRSEQGDYFLAVGLAEADDEVDLPGAAAWALEGDGSGRNCPVLRPQPLSRVHEADVQALTPEQQSLPEGCLTRFEGQCLSRDGALRLSLHFDGRSRARRDGGGLFGDTPAPAGPQTYTGRRWLEIEHVLSGVKAVFEENINRSSRFAKPEGRVFYLPELGAVVLVGLGGKGALHCLRLP